MTAFPSPERGVCSTDFPKLSLVQYPEGGTGIWAALIFARHLAYGIPYFLDTPATDIFQISS